MVEGSAEIVLVEDNASDIELALRALEKNNIKNPIQVIRDGAEALDYLFGTGEYANRSVSDRPKVILLDLKLPKVDGLEVLRQIKMDPRTRSIPVVIMTTSREDRDIAEGYRLGANSYIVKPVDFRHFVHMVKSLAAYWLMTNEPDRVRTAKIP